jgi:hypothetical protein
MEHEGAIVWYLNPKNVQVVQEANNLSPTSRQCKFSDTYIGNNCATARSCWFVSRWGIGVFHGLNPSVLIMTLVSTQPLTEMSTRDITYR